MTRLLIAIVACWSCYGCGPDASLPQRLETAQNRTSKAQALVKERDAEIAALSLQVEKAKVQLAKAQQVADAQAKLADQKRQDVANKTKEVETAEAELANVILTTKAQSRDLESRQAKLQEKRDEVLELKKLIARHQSYLQSMQK